MPLIREPEPNWERVVAVTSELNQNVQDLTKAHQSSKFKMKLLAVTLVLDILLSAAVGFLAWRTKEATDQAQSAHKASIQQCESRNEAKKLNIDLWDYVINLSGPPTTPTASQKQSEFKAYITKTFVLQDCSKI